MERCLEKKVELTFEIISGSERIQMCGSVWKRKHVNFIPEDTEYSEKKYRNR